MAIVAGLQRALFEPLLENEEDGGAGEIADVAEDVPGRLRLAFRQAERDFDVSEKARAAGMQDPALDVLLRQAVAVEEAVDETA